MKKLMLSFIVCITLISCSSSSKTSEIDGEYNQFYIPTGYQQYGFVGIAKFSSGIITHIYDNGKTFNGTFKFIDANSIEIISSETDGAPYVVQINRDEKNNVISLSNSRDLFERISKASKPSLPLDTVERSTIDVATPPAN